MARYRVLNDFCIGNGVNVRAGEVIDVPEQHVKEWLYAKHIAPLDIPPDEVMAPIPSPVNREPSLRTR